MLQTTWVVRHWVGTEEFWDTQRGFGFHRLRDTFIVVKQAFLSLNRILARKCNDVTEWWTEAVTSEPHGSRWTSSLLHYPEALTFVRLLPRWQLDLLLVCGSANLTQTLCFCVHPQELDVCWRLGANRTKSFNHAAISESLSNFPNTMRPQCCFTQQQHSYCLCQNTLREAPVADPSVWQSC